MCLYNSFVIKAVNVFILMPLQKCFLFKEVYRKDFLKNTSSWFSDHNAELGPYTRLVYIEDCYQSHAHMEGNLYQSEKKTSEVNSWPKMLDLTQNHWINHRQKGQLHSGLTDLKIPQDSLHLLQTPNWHPYLTGRSYREENFAPFPIKNRAES